MAAYLIYRYKHLCMLKNKEYILQLVVYNNKLNNLISVMYKVFRCSLHVFSSGLFLLEYTKGFKC